MKNKGTAIHGPHDLLHIASWLRRKMRDRLQGREYILTREDFLDLSKAIRYTNWMAPALPIRSGIRR